MGTGWDLRPKSRPALRDRTVDSGERVASHSWFRNTNPPAGDRAGEARGAAAQVGGVGSVMHYAWGPSVAQRLAPWAHETRPERGPSARRLRLRLGSGFRRHRPCSLSTPTSANPLPASPQTRNSRGEPTFRGREPPLWAGQSRSMPFSVARPGRAGRSALLTPRASPLRPTRPRCRHA